METKFCPRCRTVKPVGDFYKSRTQSSGYGVYCIQCEREKDREYRKTEKGKARGVRMHQQRKAQNAVRYRARHYVSHAIQKGYLIPAKECRCAVCGNEAEQYHHAEFQLFQDADGFWGWVVGNKTFLATLAYRMSALQSAQRFINENK